MSWSSGMESSWRTTRNWFPQATRWIGGPATCSTTWCRRTMSAHFLTTIGHERSQWPEGAPGRHRKKQPIKTRSFGCGATGMNNFVANPWIGQRRRRSHAVGPPRCLPLTIRGSRTSPSSGWVRCCRSSSTHELNLRKHFGRLLSPRLKGPNLPMPNVNFGLKERSAIGLLRLMNELEPESLPPLESTQRESVRTLTLTPPSSLRPFPKVGRCTNTGFRRQP